MKALAKSLIRFLLAVVHIFILYYNLTFVRFPPGKHPNKKFGGKYEYLTVLNLMFLTSSLTFSFLCDLLPRWSSVLDLHLVKGVLNAASATMSMFVCLAFWSIYAINRDLVFPAKLDAIIPPWHNHAIHTTILPASMISYILTPRGHAPRLRTLMATASCLVVAYTAWIHLIQYNTGRWVYPVLAVLSPPARVLFIAACALSAAPFAWVAYACKNRVDEHQAAAAKAIAKAAKRQKPRAKKVK